MGCLGGEAEGREEVGLRGGRTLCRRPLHVLMEEWRLM